MNKHLLFIIFMLSISVTAPAQQYGTLKDARDGRVYKTVKIGEQVWMAENLNVSTFRNGDPIPQAKTNEEWETAGDNKQPAWCFFNNDAKNNIPNGKLYNFYAMVDERGLTPTNWRILNNEDWSNLELSLGIDYASRIKSKSGWIDNSNGTNKSGFSAYPSGWRAANGSFIGFGDHGVYLSFPNSDDDVFTKKVIFRNAILTYQYPNKNFGYSVRCVKNGLGEKDNTIIINLPPSADNIKSKLYEFGYLLPRNKVSIEEAKAILKFLGAKETYIYNTRPEPFVVGRFNDKYAITIWVGTYGKLNTYGIRYGNLDLAYHRSNDSYFEFTKMTITHVAGYTQQYGSFKDTRDGKVYKTVKIGQQVWMAENLNTDRFRNGDLIPEAKTIEEWEVAGNNKQPAWCYYENAPANGAKYGKLYNWYAVSDSRGLAPVGYHIPSDGEWTILTDYLGGEEIAGSKMKSKQGWAKDGNGTNSSGFSGLPGCYRGFDGAFSYVGYNGSWWSPTEGSAGSAWGRVLGYEDGDVDRLYTGKAEGFSVRCLRD